MYQIIHKSESSLIWILFLLKSSNVCHIINSNRKNCYTEKSVSHYLLWKQNLLTKRKCYVHKLLLNSNILIMTLIKNWNSSCIPPISLEIITQAFKYGIFGVLFHKYHLNEGTFKNQKLTWNRWTATKTI